MASTPSAGRARCPAISAQWSRVAPSNADSAATGGKIQKVRQGGTELDLDLEGGTTIKITTAEETSSVMLRDKAGGLEYAD